MNPAVSEVLGWTLLHFVWQGALLGAVLSIALSAMRRRSPNARYVLCCAGMVSMLAAPLVTFWLAWRSPVEPLALAASQLPLLEARGWSLLERVAPLLPVLSFGWLAGACVLQARLVVQWISAFRLRRRGVRVLPAIWQSTAFELCERLGLRQSVRFFESSLARVPMVVGWLHPVVLVPCQALEKLTPAQLRAVLAHELAHIRRYDPLVNLFQALFESLLFYHPAVWWLSHRLREEREYCCDDVAVRVCGDALCYAQALSSLDSMVGEACQSALASTGGSLMHRIFRLVGVRAKRTQETGAWPLPAMLSLALIALISVAGLTLADGKAKDKPAKPPEVNEAAWHEAKIKAEKTQQQYAEVAERMNDLEADLIESRIQIEEAARRVMGLENALIEARRQVEELEREKRVGLLERRQMEMIEDAEIARQAELKERMEAVRRELDELVEHSETADQAQLHQRVEMLRDQMVGLVEEGAEARRLAFERQMQAYAEQEQEMVRQELRQRELDQQIKMEATTRRMQEMQEEQLRMQEVAEHESAQVMRQKQEELMLRMQRAQKREQQLEAEQLEQLKRELMKYQELLEQFERRQAEKEGRSLR